MLGREVVLVPWNLVRCDGRDDRPIDIFVLDLGCGMLHND